MKQIIKGRWSGAVLFEAELPDSLTVDTPLSLGEAIKVALKSGAYLDLVRLGLEKPKEEAKS